MKRIALAIMIAALATACSMSAPEPDPQTLPVVSTTIDLSRLSDDVQCDSPSTWWADCDDAVWLEVHGAAGVVWERHCEPIQVDPCWEELTCPEMSARMDG